MADEADLGNEAMERWLQGRLEEFQFQLGQVGDAMEKEESRCRNCQEPLPQGQHYCGEECRDDHWERIKAEKRRGNRTGQ